MSTEPLRVTEIRIRHEHDADTTPQNKGELPDDEDLMVEQEKQYVASWKRDEWAYIGILVECSLVVAGTIQTIRSGGGLWGVEDNSGDDYLQQIAEEEYRALVDVLGALGVAAENVPALATAKRVRS